MPLAPVPRRPLQGKSQVLRMKTDDGVNAGERISSGYSSMREYGGQPLEWVGSKGSYKIVADKHPPAFKEITEKPCRIPTAVPKHLQIAVSSTEAWKCSTCYAAGLSRRGSLSPDCAHFDSSTPPCIPSWHPTSPFHPLQLFYESILPHASTTDFGHINPPSCTNF